jgi:hypothetical protein
MAFLGQKSHRFAFCVLVARDASTTPGVISLYLNGFQ